MIRLLSILIFSVWLLPVHGQDRLFCTSDYSQTVYFRFDRVDIDTAYAGNGNALHILSNLFSDTTCLSLIDSVHIYAYSSPEGREAYNNRLAERRAAVMKDYLATRHPSARQIPVRLLPQGENWAGLRTLVLQAEDFDEREEVLMIIDKVQDLAKRERLIRRLNTGKAYEYIRQHILPFLRSAAICAIWIKRTNLPALSMKGLSETTDHEYSLLSASSATSAHSSSAYSPSAASALSCYPVTFASPAPSVGQKTGGHYSALKTNLAAWGMNTVNLAYEIQLGRRFSIDLPLMWSSWDITGRHALRIIAFQPELRFWLSRPGQGHFLGLHAHAARYNAKWNATRYQDTHRPLLGGGISYGYLLPLNERWGMEFMLGAGYANSRYDLYRNINNGACFDTRTLNYWGITRLGVSFIYKLPQP